MAMLKSEYTIGVQYSGQTYPDGEMHVVKATGRIPSAMFIYLVLVLPCLQVSASSNPESSGPHYLASPRTE